MMKTTIFVQMKKAAVVFTVFAVLFALPGTALGQGVTTGPFEGQKISVQDMEENQEVIIYRSVYNPEDGTYEDFIIDGNGSLVRAYDKGNRLTLYSGVSPVWKVIFHRDETTGELNGYYDFYNEETRKYLCPLGNGTIVSPERPGVTLNGRRDGEYTSTIESWDSSSWAWYGYQISNEDGIEIGTGKGDESDSFSFAAYQKLSPGMLHEVPTVDSVAAGITIKMYDFDNRDQIKNVVGNKDNTYHSGNHYEGSGNVSLTLQNGFPVFLENKNSAAQLFSNTYYKGDANGLFLSSVYNSTGYYEYSCFNNYAYYDQNTGKYTVYQETATPKQNDSRFFFWRGNFFPYDQLNVNSRSNNTNQFSGDGSELPQEDPTKGEPLYLINNGKPDYYFGMTMEFTFMQPKNGYNKGEPMVYEFNGDDDLWIYIDGVLALDIGGVHDALPGSINFATGEIRYDESSMNTTIKECFRKAGVFPDGTPWDENRVDEYFKGNTFVDYGSHKFNMFYMEHGAGASNLKMRFNLPVMERGRFAVEKELEGTDQQRFANVNFAYQAFRRNADGTDTPLTGAMYEDTKEPLQFYDGVVIGGKTYDHVFYLKPGQSCLFPEMQENTKYWVRELGIGDSYYDEVQVNDVTIDGEDVTAEDGVYPTSVDTIERRARVIYGNRCADSNLNELRITKRVPEDVTPGDSTFEFRVLLENADGSLVPYSTAPYMIRNDAGEYFHYVNGVLTSNGKTPIEASVSGNNGTIAGIPVDYTVVIPNLLAGTDFYVEEIRLSNSWSLISKTVTGCGVSDLPGTGFANDTVMADGQIILDTDAQEVFTNRDLTPVTTTVIGYKILTGRDMEEKEFVFTMEPVDPDSGVIGSGTMTATVPAGKTGETVGFTFDDISFTLEDYRNAEYHDADGNALFYYVIREETSESIDETGHDPTNGLTYDLSQYLAVIRVSLNEEAGDLSTQWSVYPYDGNSVPAWLRPRP